MTEYRKDDAILEKDGGVAILTLNRPERLNALSRGIRQGIINATEELARNDDLKVLVITGAGRAFCAGADFKDVYAGVEFKACEGRRGDMEPLGLPVICISKLEKPVIAAVNGFAVGGGFSIALACDIRIASDRAQFNVQYTNRGARVDWGMALTLPRLVGRAKALELMWNAEFIDAQQALELGIVNKVVPHEKLMEATLEWAHRWANGPSMAIELDKRLVDMVGQTVDMRVLCGYEMVFRRSGDFQQYTKDFIEKKNPVYWKR